MPRLDAAVHLDVRDLVIRYGPVTAVNGVSFSAREGEFVSLLGPSGCGKTTTLRCIAGLESAHSGEIRIGSDIVARAGREVPPEKRGVNMVFQSYAVWPHMTVSDNVAYGLRGVAQAEAKRRTEEALRLVGLSGFGDRYGTELSGGQQQRVAVARAVVTEPRLLLFDEPLSNLDAGLRERMRVELLQLHRRLGRTSIYVTHDQSEAMAMSDRIILMDKGRIVQEGGPRELYERPASRFAASFLGNANLLEVDVVSRNGDHAIVRLADDLQLRAVNAAHLASNKALVCIRPENLQATTENDAEGFAVTVARVTYLGAHLDCELEVSGLRLRATMPARTGLADGDALRIRIDPDCVVLVPDNQHA
jgi:iron(III) transport system ATP-binding protein